MSPHFLSVPFKTLAQTSPRRFSNAFIKMPIINGVQSIPKHPLENYTLLKHLGSGGQGTVTLAQHRQSGAHVAIKTISKTPRCSRAFLEDEDAEYDSSTDITSFSKPINGTIDEPRFILGRVINEYFTHCRVKSEGQLAKMIGIAHDSLNYYLILVRIIVFPLHNRLT